MYSIFCWCLFSDRRQWLYLCVCYVTSYYHMLLSRVWRIFGYANIFKYFLIQIFICIIFVYFFLTQIYSDDICVCWHRPLCHFLSYAADITYTHTERNIAKHILIVTFSTVCKLPIIYCWHHIHTTREKQPYTASIMTLILSNWLNQLQSWTIKWKL